MTNSNSNVSDATDMALLAEVTSTAFCAEATCS